MEHGKPFATYLGGETLRDFGGLGVPLMERLGLLPRSARWILPTFVSAFAGGAGSRLEPKTRTLALLHVAALEHSPYWRERFERMARSIGIPREDVELVGSEGWEISPGLEPRDHAAVLWADRVTRRLARRDRAAHETVRRWFDHEALVELTLVVSIAVMACRAANALRLPTGGGPDNGWVLRPVPAAQLVRWVERTFDTRDAELRGGGTEP